MNPLDALNPMISDVELIRSYGNSITDLVTDDYNLADVILDERIWSHKQYSDLMLLILGGREESLADWDLAPKIVRELQEEVKRLREKIKTEHNLKTVGESRSQAVTERNRSAIQVS